MVFYYFLELYFIGLIIIIKAIMSDY